MIRLRQDDRLKSHERAYCIDLEYGNRDFESFKESDCRSIDMAMFGELRFKDCLIA